jgi:hypothetical protein
MTRWRTAVLAAVIACAAAPAWAGPRVKWTFEAKGRIYTSPVAADLLPGPGLEILIGSAEDRTLHCLDARGVFDRPEAGRAGPGLQGG